MISVNNVSNFSTLSEVQKNFLNYLITKNLFFKKGYGSFPFTVNEWLPVSNILDDIRKKNKHWTYWANIYYSNSFYSKSDSVNSRLYKEIELNIYSGFVLMKEKELHPTTFFVREDGVFDPIANWMKAKPDVYLGIKIGINPVSEFMNYPSKFEDYSSPGELYFSKMKL